MNDHGLCHPNSQRSNSDTMGTMKYTSLDMPGVNFPSRTISSESLADLGDEVCDSVRPGTWIEWHLRPALQSKPQITVSGMQRG